MRGEVAPLQTPDNFLFDRSDPVREEQGGQHTVNGSLEGVK